MLVKEMNVKGAKVLIYDDYIGSKEESEKALKEFDEKASRFLAAKYRRLAMESEQAKEIETHEPPKAQDDISR